MIYVFILFVILIIASGILSFLSCKKYTEQHKDRPLDAAFIRGLRLRAMSGIFLSFLLVVIAIVIRILFI